MACLQILKSSFSVSHSNSLLKQNYFRSEFKSENRIPNFLNNRLTLCCKLQQGDNQSNGEEPPESLFMKELRRRGMTPTSLLEESNRSLDDDEEIRYMEMEEEGGFSNWNSVSMDVQKSLSNQRKRSMELNSEGLEGLIPRAKLLLTIGGTFFLGFWPLILITVAFVSALCLYFGQTFVHDASKTSISPPQFIDPYALLEDERISQPSPRLN